MARTLGAGTRRSSCGPSASALGSAPHSQARRTLRRQVQLNAATVQLPWLALAGLLAVSLASRATAPERWLVLLSLGAIAAFSFRVTVRAIDQQVGPMLDRLAHAAQATAPLDPLTGERLPALVSDNPRTALGQLAGRLEEAQEGLRAQVTKLSRLNRELADTREELLRAERLAIVGRLAAGVAHEVGNPLGALIGFVGLAKVERDPALHAEALDGIESQAQRIHRTLQELMDFSRAGKLELAPTSLASAVQAAARLVKVHPRWRAMLLEVNLAQDLPSIRGSEHHLVQVLVNLLLNAADACGGKGCVTLSAVIDASHPQRVAVLVSDDGPGIPAGEEERIFEPFVSTKPVGQGTGLGLAISRQLVESFGGRLHVRPAVRGATFEIDLSTERL